MSLESWKSFFETGGVILLFLTFVFGAGALITANRLNAIKDRELAELKLKTAEANDRAARNEQDAARLTKEAEDERMARVELQSKVAWRRIEANRQLEIAAQLNRFAGEPALIAYSPNDIEAAAFASDIAATLHKARWEVAEPLAVLSMREGPVAFGTNPGVSTGVVVWRTEDDASQRAADALVRELSSLGFDAKVSAEAKGLLAIHATPTRVVLSVEHKPEGPQGEYKLGAQKKFGQ